MEPSRRLARRISCLQGRRTAIYACRACGATSRNCTSRLVCTKDPFRSQNLGGELASTERVERPQRAFGGLMPKVRRHGELDPCAKIPGSASPNPLFLREARPVAGRAIRHAQLLCFLRANGRSLHRKPPRQESNLRVSGLTFLLVRSQRVYAEMSGSAGWTCTITPRLMRAPHRCLCYSTESW